VPRWHCSRKSNIFYSLFRILTPYSSGLVKHTVAFLASTTFAVLGSLLLLIGAAILTVMVKKAEAVNSLVISNTSSPLGIFVSVGNGILLTWAAFVCLLVSTVPYMIRCEVPQLSPIFK